jgi:hypothetical protein
MQVASKKRKADVPHDCKELQQSRPAVHLARLRIEGEYNPTSAAISPCGHFFAVSTPEATSLFGIFDPPDASESSTARIFRLALPPDVPPALTLRFGPVPAPEPGPKKIQSHVTRRTPAFRLFVGTVCGRVLLVESPASSDLEGSVSTVRASEEEVTDVGSHWAGVFPLKRGMHFGDASCQAHSIRCHCLISS